MLKGALEEEAILCTKNKTFSLKLAETSNTLLLLPKDMGAGAIIRSSENYHFETLEVPPKLQKLRVLLSKHLYSGGNEEEFFKNCFTFEQILAQVQASETQIRNSLREIGAVEHKGFWTLVDPIYLDNCFELILSEIISNDWNINNVSASECINSLSIANIPSWVIYHALKLYSKSVSEDNNIFILDEAKMSKFKGTQILRKAKNLPLDKFIEEWKDKTIYGNSYVQIDILKGIAIVNREGPINIVSYLPSENIINTYTDISSRLQHLFNIKKLWFLPELIPYINDLINPSVNTEQYLLKYSRTVNSPEGLQYTSKY